MCTENICRLCKDRYKLWDDFMPKIDVEVQE